MEEWIGLVMETLETRTNRHGRGNRGGPANGLQLKIQFL